MTNGRREHQYGLSHKQSDTPFLTKVHTHGPHREGSFRAHSKPRKRISSSAGCSNVLFPVWREKRRSRLTTTFTSRVPSARRVFPVGVPTVPDRLLPLLPLRRMWWVSFVLSWLELFAIPCASDVISTLPMKGTRFSKRLYPATAIVSTKSISPSWKPQIPKLAYTVNEVWHMQ